MKRRAFLEKIGGEWLDDFVYMSKQPLLERDFEVIEFDGDDMENTLLNRVLNIETDILIGSVQATVKFFEACGVRIPPYLGYRPQLQPWFGRKITGIKARDLPKWKNDMPYFIKPAIDVKLFTGEVISSESQLDFLREHYGLTDSTEIYISEVINIKSEYRCFVREGELKGIQYYSGDFMEYPETLEISKMVNELSKSDKTPCAYTLDVGVTEDGDTILIEMNDMWAIGSYGHNAREYVLACIRRMIEIGKQYKK
jgi:hypothetical protein